MTIESRRAALNPYEEFFRLIWEDYCEQRLDLDTAELVMEIGERLGIIVCEPANENDHAIVMSEWGLEEGDPVYKHKKWNTALDSAAALMQHFKVSDPNPSEAIKTVMKMLINFIEKGE